MMDLPSTLSIRKYKSISDCSSFADNIDMNYIEIEHNKLLDNKIDNKRRGSISIIKKAKTLLSMLSVDRVKNYLTWIDLGFCLHNIDDLLLQDWIEFSKKSSQNFKEGECEKLWNNFKTEGLGIGSLFRWAKQDNLNAYTDFILEEFDDLLKSSLNGTSASIAEVFYRFNEYFYICTGPKKNSWYEFIGHKWSFMEYPVSIINKLNDEFVNYYIRLQIAFLQKSLCVEDNNEKKNLLDKSKQSYQISLKIQDFSFKEKIIKELENKFCNPHFIDKLDENKDIICFKNGIYDLKNNIFRNGRPEDYVSMCTNIDYIQYDSTNKEILQVYDFKSKIYSSGDCGSVGIRMVTNDGLPTFHCFYTVSQIF